MSKQSFGFFLLLVASFYMPAESVLCRETRPTANFSDPVIRNDEIGDLLARYVSSPRGPSRTPLVDEVSEYLLRLYNETDSPSLRDQLQSYTLRIIFAWLRSDPTRSDFCKVGEILNASAVYVREGDNRPIFAIIDALAGNIELYCRQQARYILQQMGCKKLPETPCYQGPSCADGGFVYPIHELIQSYGRMLPCPLTRYLIKLYESHRIEDKRFGAALMQSSMPYVYAGGSGITANPYIELSNMLLDPIDKVCCCKARRERLLQICGAFGASNLDPLKNLYTTECPPGAEYQK